MGIPNKVTRLLRVVQEHHLCIEPENVCLAPPIKRDNVVMTVIIYTNIKS